MVVKKNIFGLMKLFGFCKFKKSTKEIIRDIREGYDD